MNEKTAMLLSILSKCNPQDEELRHENNVAVILNSDDYKELSHRSFFSKQFQELFAEDKIRSASEESLASIRAALPAIQPCLEDILFSIKNGVGPELTKADTPNFTDKSSLLNLSAKLQNASGKNYTNIAPDDFMEIFSDSTVKMAKDIFMNFPIEVSDMDAAIAAQLSNRKYCISAKEIADLENEYQTSVQQIRAAIKDNKRGESRRRWVKLFSGLTLLFVPSFVASLTGAISSGMLGMCTLIEFVLVVFFWLRG